MRTIRMILLGGLFIFILSSGVKKIEKEPCLTVTPSELRLFVNQHTDPYTLPIIYTLNIPAGFIPSCARLIYKPYFQAIDHRLDLTPLVVSGRETCGRKTVGSLKCQAAGISWGYASGVGR